MKFKVYDEMINTFEGVRMQCIKWNKRIYNIFCNDRFEPRDFEIKIHCEICGPNKFVPKVFDYHGHRLCNSCITRFSEMLQTATLEDCRRDRDERKQLQKNLKITEEKRKIIKKIGGDLKNV